VECAPVDSSGLAIRIQIDNLEYGFQEIIYEVKFVSRLLQIKTMLVFIIALCGACAPPPTRIEPGSAPSPSRSPGPAGSFPQAAPPAGTSGSASAPGDLQFKAPASWVKEQPTSRMRTAQFQVPSAEGDTENGSLAIFYFGPGQGGSPQANLDRWIAQFEQPDGSPSKDKARMKSMTVNGLSVSLLDLTGTYTAEMNPGAGDRQNKPQSRMLAAVVETPKGPYFVKLVGPTRTVDRSEPEFTAFLNSIEFK